MLNEWLRYLDAQVAHGVYLWGGQGQHVRDVGDVYGYISRKAQSGDHAKRVWSFYQKLRAVTDEIRFFDCSGLAMYFFQNLRGVSKNDASANGLWGGCAKIKKTDLKPGDMVFMDTAGRKTHIGYVARDGQVIEARSSGYGVEKNPLSARPWTHYGRHKWLKDAIEAGDADAPDAPQKPNLATRTVKQWQSLLLIYDPACLPKYGADGKYGDETDQAVCKLLADLNALREAIGYAG